MSIKISNQEFVAAYETLKDHVQQTPLLYSTWLSRELEGDVYLKLECLNPGRSFKIRGAMNALLLQDRPPSMVITASGGNHGLGVAIASKRLDIPCRVVLPTSTSPYRVQLLEELGAEVELVGNAWDEANQYAQQFASDPEYLYIHPFADREVMMGQGTILYEITEQIDITKIDALVASVGGGGLLAGNALASEALGLDLDLIAVETLGAESLYKSLQAGELVSLEAITSIAKTLGAKTTTPEIFAIMQRLVHQSMVVHDGDAVSAMFEFLNEEKLLVEPATSCCFAAALQQRELFKGKTSIFIVCGSNVSYGEALAWKKEFEI